MPQISTLVLILLLLPVYLFDSCPAFAQSPSYEVIFKEERAKSLPFEPKCRFHSAGEALAYEKTLSDPDLLVSPEKLLVGGLDLSLFEDYERGSKICYMSLPEYAAITDYIAIGYQLMNRALRNRDTQSLEQQKYKIKLLISALDKVLPFEGWVKRGAEIHPSLLNDHQVGNVVTYPAFTSTSTGAGFSGSVRYLIKSHSCRPVPEYINYENEVICLPGTKFKILYRNDVDGKIDLMMEEFISTQ